MDVQGVEFAAFALLRNLIYLTVGSVIFVAVVHWMFNHMDRSTGVTFREHAWGHMQDDPKAVALYFGLRVLGVTIAGGLIASAFLK